MAPSSDRNTRQDGRWRRATHHAGSVVAFGQRDEQDRVAGLDKEPAHYLRTMWRQGLMPSEHDGVDVLGRRELERVVHHVSEPEVEAHVGHLNVACDELVGRASHHVRMFQPHAARRVAAMT